MPASKSKRKPYHFHNGDFALLIDRKDRRYMITLNKDETFHSHVGKLLHKDIIGKEEGSRLYTSRGQHLLVVKPTLSDSVLEMPRIAQVIYPKDLGTIIMYGDIFPGARVLEAGTGSGALTMALLRAVGEKGHVYTYEIREEMAIRAKTNIETIVGNTTTLSMKQGNINEGFDESGLDRIVLDLPEPWKALPHIAKGLVPGGIVVSFLPTILQVHQLVEDLREYRSFDMLETVEVLLRSWSVKRRSVRPDHRMVAHTGFITIARKCSPTTLETE